MPAPTYTERKLRIAIVEHRDTDLLVAMSDDLPGLVFSARSMMQMEQELPEVIKTILEAEGARGVEVTAAPDATLPASFTGHMLMASARLQKADA